MSTSPSAPSLPLDPTRPSPFTFLPTELLRSIIESTVPVSFHWLTYYSRQSTLQSLCLVSKIFHQLASPFLLENVLFHRTTTFRHWNEMREEGAKKTRHICLGYNKDYEGLTRSDFVKMAQNHPSITSMIVKYRNARVAIFSELNNLTFLQLHHCYHLGSLDGQSVLRNVTKLGLFKVSFPNPMDVEIFSAESFPSLETLTLHKTYTLLSEDGSPPTTFLALLLLPSVKVLVMDDSLGDLERLNNADLLTLANKTLYDLSLPPEQLLSVTRVSPAVLKYCRVFRKSRFPVPLQRLGDFCSLIENWIQSSARPSRLKVLYLPNYQSDDYELYRPAVDSLEAACQNVGVEIVWEEPLDESDNYSIVSRDFARRIEAQESIEAEL